MEIVLTLFLLVGGSIAFSAWKKSKSTHGSAPTDNNNDDTENGLGVRKCSNCGHEGEMKTWLSHYTVPKVVAVVGFLLGYIPGLIFIALYWGKYRCPGCGAIGKNQAVKNVEEDEGQDEDASSTST